MAASDQDDEPRADGPRAEAPAQAADRLGWIEVIGLELTRVTAELVVAEWNLEPRHLQPHGIVHGGVYASVVETCCSLGASLAAPAGKIVVGVENHTSFIRQAHKGRLRARATPIHAGRRAQLWECSITDAAERLIATGRLRVMCVEPEPER
jgi:1,4-dihydroxy-2-naphthoyl-CoA hydrolase